jgi:hypothetical protein
VHAEEVLVVLDAQLRVQLVDVHLEPAGDDEIDPDDPAVEHGDDRPVHDQRQQDRPGVRKLGEREARPYRRSDEAESHVGHRVEQRRHPVTQSFSLHFLDHGEQDGPRTTAVTAMTMGPLSSRPCAVRIANISRVCMRPRSTRKPGLRHGNRVTTLQLSRREWAGVGYVPTSS